MRVLDSGLVLGRVAVAALALASVLAAAPAGAQAIFGDDFETGNLFRWAPCQDPTPPSITPLSPGPPLPFSGDPEHDVFNNIKNNGPVDPTLRGTFTSVPDPSTVPTEFVCFLDGGSAQICSDLHYDLSALAEGGHWVAIEGVTCAGAVGYSPILPIFVDQQPPFEVQPAAVVVDGPAASAQVTFAFADAVTNVESLGCLLDFDANGINPDLDPTAVFVPCSTLGPGLFGLPTRPAGDAPRPRGYAGTLTLSELAAGRHRLWYRVKDFWGHAATNVVDFMVNGADAGAGRFGRVVAIGHDFVPVDVNLVDLLGNAALLSRASAFSRNLRILGLDLGAADADGGKTNALNALVERLFIEVGKGFDYAEWSGNPGELDEGLAEHLLGRDVLLIYDQNDTARSLEIGASVVWLAELRTFVDDGGVVIVLDGLDALTATPSDTVRILGNAEPWDQLDPPPAVAPQDADVNLLDSGALALADPTSTVELVCRSDSPLAVGVGALPEPQSYLSPGYVEQLVQDPAANEIFCTGSPCRAVVLDKKFPLRTDTGPVRVQAFGLDSADAVAPRDHHDYAIFSAPDGSVQGVCRLRDDGTAAHDVSAGGTVTVASASGVIGLPNGSLDLESVFGVQPGETIAVGRTTNPPREVAGSIEVELPRYPDLSSAANVSYFLSDGCANATAAQTAAGVSPLVTLPTATDECLHNGTEMSLLAEARDLATGDVLAYASLANVAYGYGVFCHGATGFFGWCVNATDWPIVRPSPPTVWASPQSPLLTVTYGDPSFAPAANLEAVQVLPRHASSGVGFEEGLFPDPSFQQYFASKIPNAFADALRVNALVYTAVPAGGFSLTTDAKDLALSSTGLASTSFTPLRSRFLPRVLGMTVDTSAIERPQVTWQLGEGSLAGAQGGLGSLVYLASPSCPDPRCDGGACSSYSWYGSWSFVLPSSSSGVTMPALPDELACWRPTFGDFPWSLAFVEIEPASSGLTASDFRRSSASTFYQYFDSLRTKVGTAGDETFMSAFCSQDSFCSPDDAPDSPTPAARAFLGCYSPAAIAAILCP